VHAPVVFSRYYGLTKRRLTLFLLCLSLFTYQFNGESLKGVPTRLSDRSIPSRLDLLRRIAHRPIVRLFPVTRGRLQSQESNRVLRWDNNPSRGYMATQVTLQSTIE